MKKSWGILFFGILILLGSFGGVLAKYNICLGAYCYTSNDDYIRVFMFGFDYPDGGGGNAEGARAVSHSLSTSLGGYWINQYPTSRATNVYNKIDGRTYNPLQSTAFIYLASTQTFYYHLTSPVPDGCNYPGIQMDIIVDPGKVLSLTYLGYRGVYTTSEHFFVDDGNCQSGIIHDGYFTATKIQEAPTCTNECTSGVIENVCEGTTGYKTRTCSDSNGDGCTEWGEYSNAVNCNLGYVCNSSLNSCVCSDDNTIMKLEGESGGVGGLWNSSYSNRLCYTDIFSGLPSNTTHLCSGNNRLLSLNSLGYASTTSDSIYNLDVCYEELSCLSTVGSCPVDSEEMIYLQAISPSLLSKTSSSSYPTKICCSDVFSCNNNGTCDAGENDEFCPSDCTNINGCSPGDEWCADGSCALDCGTGNHRACNENDICDATESCYCEDCIGAEDHCVRGSICSEEKVCELNSVLYWTDEGEIPIDKISLTDNEGVYLKIENTALSIGQNYVFSIYYGQVNEDSWLKNISVTATEPTQLSARWDIDLSEVIGKEGGFYFKFNKKTSGPLDIEILDECFDVFFCSGYTTEGLCNADTCGAGELSVESNNDEIICGEILGDYKYNCGCQWNSSTETCDPKYQREVLSSQINEFDKNWIGTCLFNEVTTDTCEDDFLEYSWVGVWVNGNFTDTEGEDFISGYYNPWVDAEKTMRESERCVQSNGSKTVPCPSQIQLPLFSGINFIVSLVLISLIYSWMIFRRR